MKAAIALALVLSASTGALAAGEAIAPGLGSFTFREAGLNKGRPVRVYTSVPADCPPDAPVLVVMHGVNRDADRYRNDWAEVAARNRAVLLCPEISATDFPSDGAYNFGNVYGDLPEDAPLPPPLPEELWSFSLVDPIFETVAASLKLRTPGYFLYGHSAGSQFVHRFAFFKPSAKALRIVSANAGWYLFPDPAIPFPYGLGGTFLDATRVRGALARPVTILLGEEDTDPGHRNLRKTPGAMRQGRHRLERGRAFFEAARKEAARLGVPFRWELVTAPGVGHNDRKMAVHAERLLFPAPKATPAPPPPPRNANPRSGTKHTGGQSR